MALESITTLANDIYFGAEAEPSSPIVYTYTYIEWEANKVISSELIRNLCLTMAAVLVVTLVLISDLVTVFWVFTCIAFTLIDLLGLMYFWGLTIEISSSIIVILAAGLAIDYAAHIGHTFTTVRGSKSRRARITLSRMGPAVWNGGFSTFLAFVLLVNTDSHIFTTFFKLFFGVVVFGLFHGLAYLPVVLSWFGPAEREPSDQADESTVVDSSFNSSPERPSSTASSSSDQPAIIQKKSCAMQLALDNPTFISDHIQILYDGRYDNRTLTAMSDNASPWRPSGRGLRRMDPETPYIPQPDYTPVTPRRLVVDGHQLMGKIGIGHQMLPKIDQTLKSAEPQRMHWYSSQFPASDWNAMMMKRIAEEAHTLRTDQIRQQANQALDRFESEMDSYLEEGIQERNSTLASPGAEAEAPSAAPSTCSSTGEASTPDPTASAADKQSLESGYLSSYPGQPNGL